ncbi:MAG: acylphosphatase [Chloroflexi bacterium]|nr:acylphosphatase [Chloroflexota bacterium]MBI3733459.1 acylphosphatase [Chloroflexota bacterium]
MTAPSVRIEAVISGHVQGVYFRQNTQRQAARLGLTGYALNRDDGTVEVAAEGGRAALESLLVWLHHGPRGARVDSVSARWLEARGEFARFEVRP